LKSINEFKEMIERLNDKNNQLREKLVESERRNEVLSNENKIKDLKHKSSLNSQIMENAIDTNNK
jgi:cell division septum initiation protein DivIVA